MPRLLPGLLAGACIALIAVQAPDSIRAQESTDRREALGRLRLQLEGLQADLRSLDSQSADLLGRAARVRKLLEIQQAELREAQLALAEAIDGSASAEAELERLTAEQRKLVETLQRRAGLLYRLGRWGYLRMFLSLARSPDIDGPIATLSASSAPASNASASGVSASGVSSDPVAGLRMLRAVVERDADDLRAVNDNRRQLELTRQVLDQRRSEARSWVDRQRRVTSRLDRQRREVDSVLRALRQRRERLEREAAEVSTRQGRLNRLAEILATEGPSGLGGLAIEEFRGALDWPIRGALGRRFGPYRDEQYGTLVPHNGLQIRSRSGEPVRSVFPGRVVYAGNFQDVGLLVVLQHSREALTMYSGLGAVEVMSGDIVGLGDAVGRSSRETYFEIRVGREALDPQDWLQ